MKKWLKTYKNKNEERINYDLLNKTADGDIIEYIVDVCRSLERLDSIKFLGYEYTEDASEIDMNKYIMEKQRGKNKNTTNRFMYMTDSNVAEIVLKFKITLKDEIKYIDKSVLLPIPDDDGYYLISGTRYSLMYQITEKSTYTTKEFLVTKSNQPINMKRQIVDEFGFSIPIYTVLLFGKDANIVQIFLAKMGYRKTLEYFGVEKVMCITNEPIKDEENYIFIPISSKVNLKVDRQCFNKFSVVRTVALMLHRCGTNRLTMDNVYDIGHWITALGSSGTPNKNKQYSKGVSTLIFVDRMLDDTTKKVLLLHPINKSDTYAVLRWMMLNFNKLRAKNNMDLGTKRLRCNEYIAHLLSRTFTERINRIIGYGDRVTIGQIEEIFKFSGDIIKQSLQSSMLLRYDDNVNDMDFFDKLKVTFKGPSSQGGTSDKTITKEQRGIDPSYIGRLDINQCGTSDPGLSATLTPYCKTNGLYFDDSNEPEDAKYEFDKSVVRYLQDKSEAGCIVGPKFTDYYSYYNQLQKSEDILDSIKIYERFSDDAFVVRLGSDD